MKPAPLDGKVKESLKPTDVSTLVRIEYFLMDDVKAACSLYLRYKDKPALFVKEYPEYRGEVDEMWDKWKKQRSTIHSAKEAFMREYNTWLFKLAFKDGIE